MKEWSDPLVRIAAFTERVIKLKSEVARWQGKCAVLKLENNRLRAKLKKTISVKSNEGLQEWDACKLTSETRMELNLILANRYNSSSIQFDVRFQENNLHNTFIDRWHSRLVKLNVLDWPTFKQRLLVTPKFR
jgi:regulator of replication initiation timing